MYTYFIPHLCRYQMKFYVNCQVTMMILFFRWMIAEYTREERGSIEKVINVSLSLSSTFLYLQQQQQHDSEIEIFIGI